MESSVYTNNAIYILIPAYNEAASIAFTLAGIENTLPQASIIVCDNGSSDRTAQIAAAKGAIVTHQFQQGYGHTLMAGVHWIQKNSASENPILIFMDGDGADDPNDLLTHLENLKKCDLSIGSRTQRIVSGVTSIPHFLVNRLFGILLFVRTGKLFTDLGPFRALHLQTFLALQIKDYTYGWTAEMQRKAVTKKFRVQEFWTPPRIRFAGESKVSGTRIWKQFCIGLHIIWRIFL